MWRGYDEIEGEDFEDTFSSVARMETIKLFLDYSCLKNFKLFQMDVKFAFLNGYLKEEVYTKQLGVFE